jgi:fatty acid desaturase
MVSNHAVLADLTEFRSQLCHRGIEHQSLLRLNLTRPLADIAFDWLVIFGTVAAVVWLSGWLAPLAICVLANRQRALGNILHDAGHRNLCRERWINDLLARALVAPFVFASLSAYQAAHFKHHLSLGDGANDPDLLPVPAERPRHWLTSCLRNVIALPAWWGSFAGHLGAPAVALPAKVYMLAWWGVLLALMDALAGGTFALAFVSLWLAARATLFHLITTFREMCDHFGLRPTGILSFTRDTACQGFWRWVIHPRNNGYHLTHHLLPAVPYYRLPQAHALFQQVPTFRTRGQICTTYFSGPNAVVNDWQTGARS